MAAIPMMGTLGYRPFLTEHEAMAGHVPSKEDLDRQKPMTEEQQAKLLYIPEPKK
jgi:hypothetical protein